MDDQLHLLTGAYALNALDDDERRLFERTLAFGDPTAEEARELSETAALLAAGTTPVAPPPDLKARLMAQIAVTPQLDAVPPPHAEGSHPHAEGSHPHAEGSPAPEATVTDLGERRRRALWTAPTKWLAAAAAVLLVAAAATGTWAVSAQRQRDDAVRQLAQASDAPGAVMGRILAAPDARIQEVSVPGGGTLLIAHSRQDALAGVMTIGLPQPPAGHVYELWLGDTSGSMTPAGLVAGTGTTWNELAGGIGAAAALGVTVEPSGGSPRPTTDPLVVESFS
ncbi:hypothetical protein SCMU_35220 [Sinomonas cyclohexanicum]|uniref:Regulator of SigK n=1 Tax=Sinomonas cyclohexanicum TaxID=322009 RepID=A0ABN6FMX3_SINCY|nr:anti-sigma factor [Corynebacterium cyclohexanicum]BCT77680.1 hypothetical protein SCMU_35220 [Corynebacterium cyclohexanicum]